MSTTSSASRHARLGGQSLRHNGDDGRASSALNYNDLSDSNSASIKIILADSEAIYSYEGTREMNSLIVGLAITGESAFVGK